MARFVLTTIFYVKKRADSKKKILTLTHRMLFLAIWPKTCFYFFPFSKTNQNLQQFLLYIAVNWHVYCKHAP